MGREKQRRRKQVKEREKEKGEGEGEEGRGSGARQRCFCTVHRPRCRPDRFLAHLAQIGHARRPDATGVMGNPTLL